MSKKINGYYGVFDCYPSRRRLFVGRCWLTASELFECVDELMVVLKEQVIEMSKLKTIDFKGELRIRLSENMAKDLEQIAKYTGMDYTNLTRMALIEYMNNHKIMLSQVM